MRRTIAGLGRSLVTLGLLILLFVAYQLWGTGYFTARAQADLRKDFERAQEALTSTTVADDPVVTPPTVNPSPGGPTTTTMPPPLPVPAEGEAVGIIEIPKIGVGKVVVQGTSRDDLKKGPGHYPGTPFPGQVGNAAIAGHRTTYGAPFNRLDELAAGDEIIITLVNSAKYVYKVREVFPVDPSEVSVVANTPDAQLTLTTCHPKLSARERLIVKADLVVEDSAEPVDPATLPTPPPSEAVAQPTTLDEGLGGEEKSLGPAWGWGLIAAVVGVVWWWFFRRWRHPATWVVGVIPFLIVLFGFYVYLERALPAGY